MNTLISNEDILNKIAPCDNKSNKPIKSKSQQEYPNAF